MAVKYGYSKNFFLTFEQQKYEYLFTDSLNFSEQIQSNST